VISPHQMCYELYGNPDNPCLILITGIGGQLIDWPEIFINGLVKNGFYVLTFDNRDSGLSRSYDGPYTLEDMAQDVVILMDDLHIKKAHIFGGSMGGIIAQYVAINFPDRVLRLICMATTSGESTLPPAKPEVLAYFSHFMTAVNQ